MLILLSIDLPESCLCKEDIWGSGDLWAGSPTSGGLFGSNDEVGIGFRSGLVVWSGSG